jgi:hypothetical protein
MSKNKYRIWNPFQKKMMYAPALVSDPETGEVQPLLSGCPLMQSTGLKDKNGKEIYEGDILDDIGSKVHGQIIFINGAFIATHLNHRWDMDTRYLEVIGNIYENKELLTEPKDANA